MESSGENFLGRTRLCARCRAWAINTAGAICSICFDLPTPAVDGNVLRVLSRVMEDGAPVTNQKTKTAYREALLPLYEAGTARNAHAGAHGARRNGVRSERRAEV